MVGRVVNTLGFPIDGKDQWVTYTKCLWKKSSWVIFRQPVTEPLQTGVKAWCYDPSWSGQRELVIGDRQTGKMFVLILS
jgi:F-type H+-transporting ATPase subunit alpha